MQRGLPVNGEGDARGRLAGRTLGSYRLLSQLGRGGMGEVWLGQHVEIGRKAAVKILHPQYATQPTIVQRFFNEARAANLVKHPGIVDIYDFGRSPDVGAYLVMELIEGETLARRLRTGPAPDLQATARIVARISSAVGAAHAGGIVHRDLKPENVFLLPDLDHPGEERVKVLDFGIAKLADAGNAGTETVTGAVMGTPEYMSPEQCDGAKRVDHRTDVYALGVIAYKMMCGRSPFAAEGKGHVIALHITQPVPAPRAFRPDLPVGTEIALLRALEKNPDARFQRIEDLGRALLTAAGLDPGSIVPTGPVARSPSAPAAAPLRPAGTPPPDAAADSATSAETFDSQSTIRPETHRSPSMLAGSASELSSLASPVSASRRVWIASAIGVALAAGGASIWLALAPPSDPESASGDRPAPRGAAERHERPIAAPAPEPPGPTVLPAAPAPAMVRLAIESTPTGAAVFRLADGVKVGDTPWNGEFAEGPGEAIFLVKKPGFRTERVSLSTISSGTRSLVLAAAGAAGARPKTKPVARDAATKTTTAKPKAKPKKGDDRGDYKPPVPD